MAQRVAVDCRSHFGKCFRVRNTIGDDEAVCSDHDPAYDRLDSGSSDWLERSINTQGGV